MSAELTPVRWRDLLDEAFLVGRAYEDVRTEMASAAAPERARLAVHQSQHRRVLDGLLREYREGVPRPALSRCPFTKKTAAHSLDHYGLEGFWWNHDGPARPAVEQGLPPTWLALTGAVYQRGHVVSAPFLAKPGPEVPYVLPRLLGHPDVRAVLSSMPIGEHWGYAIAYYAKPIPWRLPRVNTWGTDHLWYGTETGEWGWDEQLLVEEDMDFELEWWIDTGKLSWIAPNDVKLQLQRGLEGCPYLGLPGRRTILRIQDGEVWSRQEVA
jgi:hypothetical protein